MCHVGINSVRPSIASSSESQWRLTFRESLRPYFHCSNSRGRNVGKKLSIPSTSRTPAARFGAPSINLLAGIDTPPASSPSQQIPSPHNTWTTGHTRLGFASTPDQTNKIDRKCLFILHGQGKDPKIVKVSWTWVSHYAYSVVTAAIHKAQTQLWKISNGKRGKYSLMVNWCFKKKGNNNKDKISTEHPIHRTFTRHGAYIKTIKIKFVDQYQEGVFWPVFEN